MERFGHLHLMSRLPSRQDPFLLDIIVAQISAGLSESSVPKCYSVPVRDEYYMDCD